MNIQKTELGGLWCCVCRSMQSKRMTRADVAAMLSDYRAYHLQGNITGVLLLVDDRFVHYLEGSHSALELLLGSLLLKDPRHMAFEELYREPISQRLIANQVLDFSDLSPRSSQFGSLEPDLLHRVLEDRPPADGRGHADDVFHRLWAEYAASRWR